MSDSQDNDLDRAMAGRLGRLRSAPVDLSGLETKLDAQLNPRLRIFSFRTRNLALAASVAVIGLMLGILFALAQRPHAVSVAELARIHALDMSGASSPMVKVSTVWYSFAEYLVRLDSGRVRRLALIHGVQDGRLIGTFGYGREEMSV